MVKAGKFQKHDLSWAQSPANIPYGLNAPNRGLWFGPINKTTAGGVVMAFNVRGPTWGFTWVDYAEFHSRPHTGTTTGLAAGTVWVIRNHNPTLWLPASLNANQTRCFAIIWGRVGGRS